MNHNDSLNTDMGKDSRMENLKNLLNELKPKENKYKLEGSNLKIGKGVIVCNDNEIIPLDSISFIETFEQRKRGYKKCIYALLLGLILVSISVPIVRIIGICILVAAVYYMIDLFFENQIPVYDLRIQNHAGRFFDIETRDYYFLKEIRAAILACMNDKSGFYSGRDNVMIMANRTYKNEEITKYGDISISGGQNTVSFGSGDAISGGTKNNAGRDNITGENNTVTNNNIVSDEEWKILKEFALERKKDFAENERNYKICNNLYVYAAKKEEDKCKSLLKAAGKAAMDIILASAPATVKAIIEKFL